MSCCSCDGYQSQFGEKHAAKDLRRYRKNGPDKTTRLLLDQLKAAGVRGASLLDIGGGIGVVHHELLNEGADSAVHVDATAANIDTASNEAAQRGHSDRVRFLRGDFLALAPEITPADVVTLDRVICCYPDMEQLVSASAARAQRLWGAVFPREGLSIKAMAWCGNVIRQVMRNDFRTFIHSVDGIDAVLRREGLRPVSARDTYVWRAVVYSRVSGRSFSPSPPDSARPGP
jgi:magnesium-protoporphyrin O-methyltransferase